MFNLEEALRDSGCAQYTVGQLIDAAEGGYVEASGWMTVKLDVEVRVKYEWVSIALQGAW